MKEKIKSHRIRHYPHYEFTDVVDHNDKLIARFFGSLWKKDNGSIYAGMFIRALKAQEDVLKDIQAHIQTEIQADEKPK